MPTPLLNTLPRKVMLGLPWLFSKEFIDSLGEGMWNHEDTAGSLIHLALGLAAIFGIGGFAIWRPAARPAALYGFVALGCYCMLMLISYGVDLFGVRYQLPFFILCAPLVGVAGNEWLRKPLLMGILMIGLLAAAVPYLLLNNTRPLVGWNPKTRVESVLVANPVDVLYAMAAGYQDEHLDVARRIQASGCGSVGLRTDQKFLEYYWWWLLDAPQSGVRVEYLTTYPPLDVYLDPAFEPCAVVCTVCQEDAEVEGLPLNVEYGGLRLYMAPQAQGNDASLP